MSKNVKIFLGVFLGLLAGSGFLGPKNVRAALTFGPGYYTNLCDSGTNASFYNCNPGCNPVTGNCSSSNAGVVKYICYGKWNQCLESESQWSNFEQLSGTGCGNTVQLSLYNKKCRRDDGSWDSTCNLLGYMVWYAGDCTPDYVQTSPIPTPVGNGNPVPTPTFAPAAAVQSGLSAVLTPVNPTVTPTLIPTVTPGPTSTTSIICNLKCQLATDCNAGFACVNGTCRNPACTGDPSCFCSGSAVAGKPVVLGRKTPDTGVDTWLGIVGMLGLGIVGVTFRRWAKKIW